MDEIIIKDGKRYLKEKNCKRRICDIEGCKYRYFKDGFCRKHTIDNETQKICITCIKVKDLTNFDDQDECKRCRGILEIPEKKKQIIFYKDGEKYTTRANRNRLLCSTIGCNRLHSARGLCKKHLTFEIPENSQFCNNCNKVKNFKEFTRNGAICKMCNSCRNYCKKYDIKQRDERRKFLLALKIRKGGECVDCGVKDLEVLEFDHIVGDKIDDVTRIPSLRKIQIEAEKCVLRCVICHLIKTKNTRFVKKDEILCINALYNKKRREELRNLVDPIKINSGCTICGYNNLQHPQTLQFDHISPSDKINNISNLIAKRKKFHEIQEEINKCRVLCGNCHKKHTLRQNDAPLVKLIEEINNGLELKV